ncbi:uncharacterized protein LOC108863753 [Galendromus occidentalis]|uniref:Uncharacterized protein LOC108863753 n=1 Tax=Galendromus occidentalis TaxID=34638 RepID=A0AAJ7SER6_9ACAR|nr:uncharacterized protein LOC108863753 [Galendromus occidentalis]
MKLSAVLTVTVLFGGAAALPTLFPRLYMEPCGDGAGVCMTGIECGFQRGRSLGSCVLGTCCRLEKTCGGRIVANNTYFVSPYESVRGGSSCSVEVQKKWHISGICQMRLDFIEFDTVGPNFATGACIHDSFSVSGADRSVPTICGRNNKQHMYIDVRNARSIRLNVNLGQNSTSRQWKIRVSQIPCYSERLAPPNCLQYFEEDSGIISSFNYGSLFNDSSYPLDLRYRMCFRDACIVQLTQVGAFGLGEKPEASGRLADNLGELSDRICDDLTSYDENRKRKAYLTIDGIKFCGNKFLRSFRTRNAISSIGFNSPEREEGRDDYGRAPYPGFQLQYKSNCGRQ